MIICDVYMGFVWIINVIVEFHDMHAHLCYCNLEERKFNFHQIQFMMEKLFIKLASKLHWFCVPWIISDKVSKPSIQYSIRIIDGMSINNDHLL